MTNKTKQRIIDFAEGVIKGAYLLAVDRHRGLNLTVAKAGDFVFDFITHKVVLWHTDDKSGYEITIESHRPRCYCVYATPFIKKANLRIQSSGKEALVAVQTGEDKSLVVARSNRFITAIRKAFEDELKELDDYAEDIDQQAFAQGRESSRGGK